MVYHKISGITLEKDAAIQVAILMTFEFPAVPRGNSGNIDLDTGEVNI